MSEKYELPPDVVLSQGEEWAWKHAIVKEFIKEALSRGFKDGRQSMLAERDAAISRAEAAEAQVAKLREAAKPFVEFEKTMRLWKTGDVASWGSLTIQEAVPDWEVLLKGSYPIDERTAQSVIIRAAHIRALARAALEPAHD